MDHLRLFLFYFSMQREDILEDTNVSSVYIYLCQLLMCRISKGDGYFITKKKEKKVHVGLRMLYGRGTHSNLKVDGPFVSFLFLFFCYLLLLKFHEVQIYVHMHMYIKIIAMNFMKFWN